MPNIEERSSDAINTFEKDPFKSLVEKELQRSKTLGPLKPELTFMTNLQNIKQGLKSDYSDKQILDLLLVNLSFTDELIN